MCRWELIAGEEVRCSGPASGAHARGTIINVVDSEATLAGKKSARPASAPAPSLPGGQAPPQGHQPADPKAATIDVEVKADKVQNYSVSFMTRPGRGEAHPAARHDRVRHDTDLGR
jgi:hypothetical protein